MVGFVGKADLPEIGAGWPLVLNLSARALTDKGFDLSGECHGGSVKILSNNECFRKYLDIWDISMVTVFMKK